ERMIADELRGNVTEIIYRPALDSEWVRISDSQEVDAVVSWLYHAGIPRLGSYPHPNCDLTLKRRTGDSVSLRISQILPDAEDKPRQYVTLEWQEDLLTLPLDSENPLLTNLDN